MAALLTQEQFNHYLQAYYQEHWGIREDDHWYEQPAVNVWVFGRENRIITLKSHVLTGEVEEKIETL